MPDSPTDLIGTSEAARIIDCDKSTLTRAVADGRITATRLHAKRNGSFVFTRAEVHRFRDEFRAEEAARSEATR